MVGDEPDRADEDALDAARVEAVELLEDVRAEPRLAGRRSRSGTRTTSDSRPARSATSCDVSSSWSRYGSPWSRIRAGRLCAVKTTCASVPRTRSASTSRYGSCVVPALDEPELGAACERLARAARGSRRSRASSSAARGRGRRSVSAPPSSACSTASAILGRPVLHADVDGQAELPFERRARSPRSRRRAASARRSAGSARSAPRPPRPRPAARRGCPRGRDGCPSRSDGLP